MILRCYAVLASVSRCYSALEGRLVTCYSPGRHFTQGLLPFLVRLACVRHAASVDSEPGSNSRLKPDACRRVVGRLPSHASRAAGKGRSWFQQRGWRHHSASSLWIEILETKTMVVYLVRSLGLMPEPISHDWHVQPSCQRPNRNPPRRREFSPGENARKHFRLSSKLDNHTGRRISRQSSLPTEFPDDFHIGNQRGGDGRAGQTQKQAPHRAFSPIRNDMVLGGRSNCAQPYAPSVRTESPLLRSPDTEDKKLRKDPCYLEVLALKVPFGLANAFRMKSRGRDN